MINWVLFGYILIGVWIYMVLVLWKKKASLFHDKVEPNSAERLYKILKAFLLIAGVSLAVSVIAIVLHNGLSALNETDESISFYTGLVALGVFMIATICGLVIFLIGSRKTK
ncbi:MAG: hypothetical protein NTV30_04900 [Chloroflexi bacterium]|nr:hypothetical protein [Chloroflexota bacterium]